VTHLKAVAGRPWLPLAAIVVLGAGLRLYRLTFQSLWLDELFSVIFSRSGATVAEIVEVYLNDVHPLIYPLLLHFWMIALGDSEYSARLLSALLGVMGIVAMYVAGKMLGGVGMGLAAALVTACNPYHIVYSQEARSYSLVFLVAALSFVALVMLLHRPGWRWAVSWGVLTAFACHVHYYALVMLVGQVVAVAAVHGWRRAPWRHWGYAAVGPVLVGLSVLPWVGPLLRVAEMDEYWPDPPKPWFFLEYFHRYFGEGLVLSVAAGGMLVALPWLIRRRRTANDSGHEPDPRLTAIVLAISVSASLLVAYLRSVMVVPMLMPRFTFVLVPAVLLLLAMAINFLQPRRIRPPAAIAVAVLSVAVVAHSGYYTEISKEQWREAVQTMASDPRFDPEGDRCLAVTAPGFQYYADRQLPGYRLDELTVQGLRSVVEIEPRPVLWLMLARGERPDEEFRRIQQLHFQRTDRWQLFKTAVERWQPTTASETR
jgi:uncharacterized membrane protein